MVLGQVIGVEAALLVELDQLQAVFTSVVKADEAKKFFNSITNEPWSTTRAEAHQAYLKEYKNWGDYVRIANIEPQG